MASLVAKKKGKQLYYYVVESARVDGQPRIFHQTYPGNAGKVASLVKDRTAPVPLSASSRDFGLPGALWLAAQQTGVFTLLGSLFAEPRSGPSPAHYLLLAAIHRICQPGPRTKVPDWYRSTILHSAWGFPPERFRSQEFWDAFEQILPEHVDPFSSADDPLDQAQLRLPGLWKEMQRVSRRPFGMKPPALVGEDRAPRKKEPGLQNLFQDQPNYRILRVGAGVSCSTPGPKTADQGRA